MASSFLYPYTSKLSSRLAVNSWPLTFYEENFKNWIVLRQKHVNVVDFLCENQTLRFHSIQNTDFLLQNQDTNAADFISS